MHFGHDLLASRETWFIVALIAAVILGIAIAVQYRKLRRPKRTNLTTADEFIVWLDEFEEWYTKSSHRLHIILTYCRVLPVILGFAIAIISALPPNFQLFGFSSPIPRNIVIVALTAITTICVAIITQLGVADLAKAREAGRIDVVDLVTRAKLILLSNLSKEDLQQEMLKFNEEVTKLEHEQAALYVSTFDGQNGKLAPPAPAPPAPVLPAPVLPAPVPPATVPLAPPAL